MTVVTDAKYPEILIIDDDEELCGLLDEFLHGHGFAVSVAHDGLSGLARALSGSYALIVLDVMLPRLDGFEMLRQLRRRSSVPVIMLTARAAERDRLGGFDLGADDYLVKPFAASELLARIRAVTRRTRQEPALRRSTIQRGLVRVDPQTNEAWAGRRKLALTSSEFAILDLLVRAAGRIVSRDELAAALYQRPATAYERAVDVHIGHLRKKLEPECANVLMTIRGIGFIFIVPE